MSLIFILMAAAIAVCGIIKVVANKQNFIHRIVIEDIETFPEIAKEVRRNSGEVLEDILWVWNDYRSDFFGNFGKTIPGRIISDIVLPFIIIVDGIIIELFVQYRSIPERIFRGIWCTAGIAFLIWGAGILQKGFGILLIVLWFC